MFCHCDNGFITACSKELLKTDVHINATTGSTGAGVIRNDTFQLEIKYVALQSIRPPAFGRN
jgi:hypothetical protein